MRAWNALQKLRTIIEIFARLVTCYEGNETVFWRKHEGRESSAFAEPIEQSTRLSGAERGASADDYLPGFPNAQRVAREEARWPLHPPERLFCSLAAGTRKLRTIREIEPFSGRELPAEIPKRSKFGFDGRGRDTSYPMPPSQIPASGTTTPGSYLELWRAKKRSSRQAAQVYEVQPHLGCQTSNRWLI